MIINDGKTLVEMGFHTTPSFVDNLELMLFNSLFDWLIT